MKKLFTALFLLFFIKSGWAQPEAKPVKHNSYKPHSIMATASLGAIDPYRYNYSFPIGYEKNNTTGFAPVYLKIEYGFWKHVSLAATFGYDAFAYNFYQLYQGFSDTIKRYKTDNLRIFCGGVTAFYHLGQYVNVKHLDPFIGVGVLINNIRYNAYPQGDSLVVKTDHIAALYLKAGARYYISDKISLYGDIGYDKQSIISLGISCRFYPRRHNTVLKTPAQAGS